VSIDKYPYLSIIKKIKMEKSSLIFLDLCTPLFYLCVNKLPSKINQNDEFLLCYDLNPIQSLSIEPNKEDLAGTLVFSGYKAENSRFLPDKLTEQTLILPAGKYLFSQHRDVLSKEKTVDFYKDWLDLAIEQQKDGLWERYRLKNKLFVRYLFEDGKFVTQIFRVIS